MSAINSVSTAAPPSSTRPFDALSSDEFLRIMFTELSNQDPLAPSDTKEILNQIGVIRTIESNLALTENLSSIVKQNEVSAAGNLIGKYVSGRTTEGESVEDFVISITVSRTGPVLNLVDGHRIPLKQVEEIFDPAIFGIAGQTQQPGQARSTEPRV